MVMSSRVPENLKCVFFAVNPDNVWRRKLCRSKALSLAEIKTLGKLARPFTILYISSAFFWQQESGGLDYCTTYSI